MPNSPAPVDKDTVSMVVNTIESWKQQRQFHAQKLAEFDELFRRIGIQPPPEAGPPEAGSPEMDSSEAGARMGVGSVGQIKVMPHAGDNFQPRRTVSPEPSSSRLSDDDFEQYIAQTKAKLASGNTLTGGAGSEGTGGSDL